jgi:hypothetical protein
MLVCGTIVEGLTYLQRLLLVFSEISPIIMKVLL